MAKSQVITFYNTLKREIIINRAIDAELISGTKTQHFNDGQKVIITENTKDKIKREAEGREGSIVDNVALLNELYDLIFSDAFMVEYNKKTMGFFETLYPYVNAGFKDINALELNNEAENLKKIFGKN